MHGLHSSSPRPTLWVSSSSRCCSRYNCTCIICALCVQCSLHSLNLNNKPMDKDPNGRKVKKRPWRGRCGSRRVSRGVGRVGRRGGGRGWRRLRTPTLGSRAGLVASGPECTAPPGRHTISDASPCIYCCDTHCPLAPEGMRNLKGQKEGT